MKGEVTQASKQSVKFRSCLSLRQDDINLKSVFIIAEGGGKESIEVRQHFHSREYCMLLL